MEVAEGCNEVDIKRIHHERRTHAACLEKQLEREERDEAIIVHRSAHTAKMNHLLHSFNADPDRSVCRVMRDGAYDR